MLNFFFFSLLFFLPFNEVFRVHLFNGIFIRPIDIIVISFNLYLLIKQQKFEKKFSIASILLAGSLTISLVVNLSQSQLSSFAYLLRFLNYLLFLNLVRKSAKRFSKKSLEICLIFILLSGFIQYFFYPDLRNLLYLGYDPHLYRLFGLELDPNSIGLIFLWSICWFLVYKNYLIVSLFVLGLILTFSRISWGIFVILSLIVGYNFKHFKVLGLCLLLLVVIVIIIPKRFGEGNNLLRVNSIYAKQKSFNKTLNLLKKNYIFGVGFNNLPYYQNTKNKTNISDNSQYGIDNSFFTIVATSGIFGLITYLYFFIWLWKNGKFWQKMLVLCYFLHSLSVNSFFGGSTFVLFSILYWKAEAIEHKSL